VPFDFVFSLTPPALVPVTVGKGDDEFSSREVFVGQHCRVLDGRDPRGGLTVQSPAFALWRIEYLGDDWHVVQQDVIEVLLCGTLCGGMRL